MTIDQVNRNARLCQWLELHWGVFFGGSIMVFYYQQHGLSQNEVFILQATIAIMAVLYDFPGGYLADRFGIRRNMLIGTGIIAVCAVVFCFCQTFWQFEIVLAASSLGWCSTSNTTPALMKATLNALEDTIVGQKERDQRLDACVVAIAWARNVGLMIGIVGGWGWYKMVVHYGLVYVSQDMVFTFQPVVYMLAVIVAWRLVDPPSRKVVASVSRTPFSSMKSTAKMMLHDRPDIRWFVITMAIVQTAALACFWLLQPALQSVHMRPENFGAFYVGKSIVTLILGKCAALLRYFGDLIAIAIVLGIVVATTLSVGLLSGVVGVVVLFFGHAFATAFMGMLQTNGLDVLLPESGENRTSELSVCTAASSLLFAVTTPFLGMAPVGAALVIVGSTGLCVGVCVLHCLYRAGFGR